MARGGTVAAFVAAALLAAASATAAGTVDTPVRADGTTPLQMALLLKAGADPESANADGETALHLVARAGNVEAAKLLLKARAKVDPRENFGGQTPLMWAVARRHPEMVELLASKGADVNARGAIRDYRRVATAESRAKSLDRGGLTPLLYAAPTSTSGTGTAARRCTWRSATCRRRTTATRSTTIGRTRPPAGTW